MNIFYLSDDINKCVQYHCDKHVVKMILEYAQLLSTAHRVLDNISGGDQCYKTTHINHPSAIWVRDSESNYSYLYLLWSKLMREYTHRYNKEHACSKFIDFLWYIPENIESKEWSYPPLVMPDQYKQKDVVLSYQAYYNGDKSRFAKWTNRDIPTWFNR